MHVMPHPDQTRRMTTDELRAAFLVDDLFEPDEVTLRAVDLDRVILGGAVPLDAPLPLEAPAALGAEYFAERREIGVLSIGGAGRVRVDGDTHALGTRDMLYIGRGSRDVVFESESADEPARFYLVSYPAHAEHPTRLITRDAAQTAELGGTETANRRVIRKYIHPDGARSAQLVMGITELAEGSVWNTMPAHTHQRRSEVYLYFQLPGDDVVFHFMGMPAETRGLIVRDGEVALSPSWSIHAGCGTRRYTFCWAMGGENQDFGDMQGVAMSDLR
jgi:4-deoxy-L-threo-5-hexosulose-uronate ketol-isomerase